MNLTEKEKDFIKKYVYINYCYEPSYKYRIITNKNNKSYLQRKKSFFGYWKECDIRALNNYSEEYKKFSEEYKKFLEIKYSKEFILFLFNICKESFKEKNKIKEDEDTISECEYIQ